MWRASAAVAKAGEESVPTLVCVDSVPSTAALASRIVKMAMLPSGQLVALLDAAGKLSLWDHERCGAVPKGARARTSGERSRRLRWHVPPAMYDPPPPPLPGGGRQPL